MNLDIARIDLPMIFNRGDTMPFKVKMINKDGSNINVSEIDTLFVTCRKRPIKSSPILFQKTLEDITIDGKYAHIVFEAEDTENLVCDRYFFDVEITLKNGYRKSRTYTFEIEPETTIHGGDE